MRHERWAGDLLVKHFNRWRSYSFVRRAEAGEAPDLVYQDAGGQQLLIEVVTAYYDPDNARFTWLNARSQPHAPSLWQGVDSDRSLVANITSAIARKCSRRYGAGCVLVVAVMPQATTAADFDRYLRGVRVPEGIPFDGIYVVGSFGTELGGSGHEERAWCLCGPDADR